MQPISSIVDIATHFRSGGAPRIGFTQLAPAIRDAAPAPLFLLGHANAVVHDEIYGQLRVDEVGCYSLQDALVAPTGVALKDGTAFTSQAFIHPPHHVKTITDRVAAQDLPVRHVAGKLAVIYGPGNETYGHWLADFLPRLWVLHEAGHDLDALKFVIPRDLSETSRRLLERVGIGGEQLVRYAYWSEIISTDLLLMPTGMRTGNRISPLFRQATAFWTRRMLSAPGIAASPYGPKIMLSRGGAPQQRELVNRVAIEAVAEAHGYAIVSPETLSLVGQAAMFQAARCIVGEYGSALHGSVYAAAGTVVCGLRGNSRHPSFIQSGIAGGLSQYAGYVLGDTAGQDMRQRFSIERTDFERALEIMQLSQDNRDQPGEAALQATQVAVRSSARGYSPLDLEIGTPPISQFWNTGRSLPCEGATISPSAQAPLRAVTADGRQATAGATFEMPEAPLGATLEMLNVRLGAGDKLTAALP